MAFFDDLSKKVSKAAQVAAKKSSELVETTKLNANISSQEDSIKRCYLKMGEMCFDMFKNDALTSADLKAVCEEIVGYQDKIAELREKIAEIKAEANKPEEEKAAVVKEEAPVVKEETAATQEAASTVSLDKPADKE